MEHTDLQSKVVSSAAFQLDFFMRAFVCFLPCRFWKCCALLSRLHTHKVTAGYYFSEIGSGFMKGQKHNYHSWVSSSVYWKG